MKKKMSENSLKNLRPLNTRDPEEVREITRKGGIRSGEVQRQRRTAQQILDNIELETISNQKTGEVITKKEAMLKVLYDRAIKGDIKATKMILQIQGELISKAEILNKDELVLGDMSNEELDFKIKQLIEQLDSNN